MPQSPEQQSEREFFVSRYGRLESGPARQVERDVLGREVGLNGFTTIEQARALLDFLELRPGRLVSGGGAPAHRAGAHGGPG